ncbi:hypothetical protein MWU53_07265 [Aliiroseovarius sp. S1123]|uniref:hypothetical protein n=1 Tax=unclassified Aliiroseovarius TaxID=2623558 RepID=UPI001FF4295D|nr:hypothetical protein [Aliiroseovarius sp. S1123]MCK0170853.1 hypothetical protein [Aliiroseovarius sp. S1123]
MVRRLFGAILRAGLMVMLVATPSVLVPGVSTEGGQVVAILALAAAALTTFEYATTYPSIVEFRNAPPFNRIRFLSLFASILCLSIIARSQTDPSIAVEFLTSIGILIGQAIDFPYSPVHAVVSILPADAPFKDLVQLRAFAGMSYLISLLSVAVFLIALRLTNWPFFRQETFNLWVNLPTFSPTRSGDIVRRLKRDARWNIALGFLLPFLTPMIVVETAALFDTFETIETQTIIWTVAAWAFLPASLFMRGIAMQRVAIMISAVREKNGSPARNGQPVTA